MLTQVLNIIFGSKNDREIKALRPIVERINGLESSLTPLSDQAPVEKTQEFKKRLEDGNLDDILPGGLCGLPGNVPPPAQHAALRRAAHRRHDFEQRPDRRNEDR
ncbi:MAG: hypothetical protein R3B08_03145 [Nitrospira sp.]